LVDDDKEDILLAESLLREGLKGVALELDKADSFVQALSQIEKTRYDLLMFDYKLGEKDGLDLMRDVRAKGIDTPVVFFTGRGDEEVAVEIMKLGAADYLPKSKLTERLVRRSVRYAIELHEKEKLHQRMEEELRQMNRKLEGTIRDLERRSRESCLLDEVGKALQTCMSIDEAYALLVQHIPAFFPGSSGALYMFDESRKLIEAVTVWGDNPPHEHEFMTNECWGLRRGRSYWVRDSRTELLCPHLSGSSSISHFCVPMMAYGETLGLMVLQGNGGAAASTEPQELCTSESQRRFAETSSEHLALALANLKLLEALRKQALHDPLTGLFNRRYMEEFLERAISSALRHKRPLAMLMMDLDHFKKFNDTYGHEAGDTLLRFLGQFLQSHCRGGDISCRYGGEEFVLILPEVSLAAAPRRAEQLRATLKAAQSRTDFPGHSMLTVSMGISAAPEHGYSAQALLRIADAALYQAKTQGRDRVIVGEAPTSAD
jgi:diguanylate cyclase (GGDEF)-like protein